MKTILTAIIILLIGCAANIKLNLADDSPAKLRQTLSHSLKLVDGAAVGDGASPGLFYTIGDSLIIIKRDSVYFEFIQDTNPNVRILGLYCLANTNNIKAKDILNQYIHDTSKVQFMPFGCIISQVSFGSIVTNIIENPRFLDLKNR
jgi:hypothetical protein